MNSEIKKIMMVGILIIVILTCLICGSSMLETVNNGKYHVYQWPISGTMKAKMNPGMYIQAMSNVNIWPVSNTYYFMSTDDENVMLGNPIKVRFNDGSMADMSGTLRIDMPKNKKQAIKIQVDMGYRNMADLEQRLILPIVRKSMKNSANMMSARASYQQKRAAFISNTWDQIENGVYVLKKESISIADPEWIAPKNTPNVKPRMIKTEVAVIQTDKNGIIRREKNPLIDTGIVLANFEIKEFGYEAKVNKQITAQQERQMRVDTARMEAVTAEQEAKTIAAKGKAAVAQIKYSELKVQEQATIEAETSKVVAELNAEKEKKVAELNAKKLLEVAKLNKKTAALDKAANILEGQGIAEKKKLIMNADGALENKLKAMIVINKVWANAYKSKAVPEIMISGGNNEGGALNNQFTDFMNMMNINTAKQLKINSSLIK